MEGVAPANGGAGAAPPTADAGGVSLAATSPAASAMASFAAVSQSATAVTTQPSSVQHVPQQPSAAGATTTVQQSFAGTDPTATAAWPDAVVYSPIADV